jgi:hypothetical protein
VLLLFTLFTRRACLTLGLIHREERSHAGSN